MRNDARDVVLECRIAKIELEHEVLLREMDVVLATMAGLPFGIMTLILQFDFLQNGPPLLVLLLFVPMALSYLWDYRTDGKEKIVAKEKELDALILEIAQSCDQVSKSQ